MKIDEFALNCIYIDIDTIGGLFIETCQLFANCLNWNSLAGAFKYFLD